MIKAKVTSTYDVWGESDLDIIKKAERIRIEFYNLYAFNSEILLIQEEFKQLGEFSKIKNRTIYPEGLDNIK